MTLPFEYFVRSPVSEAFVAASLNPSVTHFKEFLAPSISLLDETELNDVLSRLLVSPGMIRLIHAKQTVPDGEFLTDSASPVAALRRIKPDRLLAYLSSGATLILYCCRGLFPRIATFGDTLESLLRVKVEASLVVTLVPEMPGRAHWDGSDSLISQLSGQKRWPVRQPMYSFPLQNGFPNAMASDAAWDDTLASGDALYVPRGWIHQPVCTKGPSIHVTFSPMHPNGMDLLKNIMGALAKQPHVRMDLPLLRDHAARIAYSRQLKDLVCHLLDEDALEARYQAYQLAAQSTPVNLKLSEPHVGPRRHNAL